MRPIGPEEVERFLMDIADEVDRAVEIVNGAETAATEADTLYSRRLAEEFLDAKGTAVDRKHKADLAVAGLAEDRAVKRLALSHAQRRLKGIETKLTAYQSVGRLITAFAASGRGR